MKPRRSLQLYLYLKEHMTIPFTITDIQKSIATLTREEKLKGKSALLIESKIQGVVHYYAKE
jgi:hypothetical protein